MKSSDLWKHDERTFEKNEKLEKPNADFQNPEVHSENFYKKKKFENVDTLIITTKHWIFNNQDFSIFMTEIWIRKWLWTKFYAIDSFFYFFWFYDFWREKYEMDLNHTCALYCIERLVLEELHYLPGLVGGPAESRGAQRIDRIGITSNKKSFLITENPRRISSLLYAGSEKFRHRPYLKRGNALSFLSG